MWIDGTACRGSVAARARQPARPRPAVVGLRRRQGQHRRARRCRGADDRLQRPGQQPEHNPPDLTPFNTDFEALMGALQAEASVQRVLMLNLRTTDARTHGRSSTSTRHQRPPHPVRRQPRLPEAERRQLARPPARPSTAAAATTAASRATASRPGSTAGRRARLRHLPPSAARRPARRRHQPRRPGAGRQPLPARQRQRRGSVELPGHQPQLPAQAPGPAVAPRRSLPLDRPRPPARHPHRRR